MEINWNPKPVGKLLLSWIITWSYNYLPVVIIIIIIIIIITPSEFFIPVLAEGISLKSEWLQVSLGHQDFSQNSSQPQ